MPSKEYPTTPLFLETAANKPNVRILSDSPCGVDGGRDMLMCFTDHHRHLVLSRALESILEELHGWQMVKKEGTCSLVIVFLLFLYAYK